jgi:hypothetical protein
VPDERRKVCVGVKNKDDVDQKKRNKRKTRMEQINDPVAENMEFSQREICDITTAKALVDERSFDAINILDFTQRRSIQKRSVSIGSDSQHLRGH